MTGRQALLIGAVFGATGVIAGAFGAHALRGRLAADDLAVFETADRYQMNHAITLVALAGWLDEGIRPALEWAARLFVIGVLLFSGSLYALAFAGPRWLGMITPIGGAAFIGGWLALATAAVRGSSR
jgi:uncharacterized membrane protein YgdD (TMEM256/DUF423 family)